VRALVIGAGVAGPVAALALQRAGIEACVFEAHKVRAEEVGSYLTIAVNALDALAAIDAHHVVTSVGFPTSHNRMMSCAGTPLRTFAIGKALRDGTQSHTVKRDRLYRVLVDEATRRGVVTTYGKRLVGAATNARGEVVARFADGSEAVGDLLIGCDGIRSVVRDVIDPDAPPPRYVGMVNFGGYAPPGSFPISLGTEPGLWNMRYGRRAFFGHVTDPDGGVVWFVNAPRDMVTAEERATTTAEQWREQLIALMADDIGPAAALIAAGDIDIAADNVFDHPSTPRWCNDSMVVIGDAAHAPSSISGQGAGMAIEDAVVLAQCLRDVPDTSHALVTYEAIRRVRVERMVEQVARGVSNKLPGRIAYGSLPRLWPRRRRTTPGRVSPFSFEQRLRDTLLRVVFLCLITEETTRWTYDHHIEWSAPVAVAEHVVRTQRSPVTVPSSERPISA
jgi:2-polyprenyl-6-methoxyphenol hydroxylase-like FAD-dependent oxidoreductase